MHVYFADTVKLFGKLVTDPELQAILRLAYIPLFFGAIVLVCTRFMVDEKRARKEPNLGRLFRKGAPPRRVLSDAGRRAQVIGLAAMALGAAMIAYVAVRTR